MRFANLLHDADLGLAVIHAADRALEREVTGAYITDLPDPSRFISPGEVVLTSGMQLGRPWAPATFIAALAERQAAALVVGLIHLGQVPDEVLALCREHDLTLATISDRVSFRAVVEAIDAARAGSAIGLAAQGLRFATRLAEMVASGGSAESVLQEFSDEFGIDSWLIDDIGTLVASTGTAPAPARAGRVWNRMLEGEDTAPITGGEGDEASRVEDVWTAWPILGSERQVVGYLVLEGAHQSLARKTPIVIDGLIGALRVGLEFSARWRRINDGHVSELVQALVQDSASPGEVSARMRLESLDPQEQTCIAVAEVPDPRFPVSAVLEMGLRLLAGQGAAVAGCLYEGRAILLANGPLALDRDSIAPLAERFTPFLAGRQLRMGVSDPRQGVGHLATAIGNAEDRLREAPHDDPFAIVTAATLRTHRAILAEMGKRGRVVFAQEVLAPLLEYDTRHGTDLVSTLRVFLHNGGAWQNSARQLHLHTNTLRYRVARIEELTGRSLGEMGDRVDMFLALSCLDGE